MTRIAAGDLVLRDATPADVPDIVQLIRELAEYERDPDAAVATPPLVHDALFGAERVAHAIMAELGTSSGRTLAGFALWFHNFSTWTGRRGLYLEDLFVRPAYRGQGIGGALLRRLAAIAAERGCARMEWSVLKWNVDAIRVYEQIGAAALDGWTVYRLTGDGIAALARGGAGAPTGG